MYLFCATFPSSFSAGRRVLLAPAWVANFVVFRPNKGPAYCLAWCPNPPSVHFALSALCSWEPWDGAHGLRPVCQLALVSSCLICFGAVTQDVQISGCSTFLCGSWPVTSFSFLALLPLRIWPFWYHFWLHFLLFSNTVCACIFCALFLVFNVVLFTVLPIASFTLFFLFNCDKISIP